jgi:hypothetical protein
MSTNHGWNTQQLEEDWYYSCRSEYAFPDDEFDPNPAATLEQDAEYILSQQILKEFQEVRNSLPANLTSLEVAEALVQYNHYEGYVEVPRHRRCFGHTYLAKREEFLTKEELDALNADLNKRLQKARQKYLSSKKQN